MIYLIGVDHEIQHDGIGCASLSLRNKFSVFLKNKIVEYDITLLAEEFSEEALYEISKGKIATVKNVAEELKSEKPKVEHKFCDPNKKERKIIGIPCREEIKSMLNIQGPVCENSVEDNRIKEEERKYYPTREQFWFGEISNYLNRNIIFVCGAEHVRNFEILLTEKKYKPIILVESWGK